jgi:hypothetical protein
MGMHCKEHGKPKDQMWHEKQIHGGTLMRFGCVDCKAAAKNQPPASGRKSQTPRLYWRNTR